MGEVKVQTRLVNVVDEVLVRRGLMKPEEVRSYEAEALVDTGAVRCVVPAHVRERLGLALAGEQVAEYADGRHEAVGLTEPIRFRVLDRDVVEDAVVLGDQVLIGQTLLEKADLMVDCTRNRLIPNPAHPDQPVVKIK